MKRVITVLACPQCKSTNITQAAGGITGTHACKDCGYRGVVILQRRVEGENNRLPKRKKVTLKKIKRGARRK